MWAGHHYCAVCDANFFEDFEIYVVGGNGIAAEESLVFGRLRQKGHHDPQRSGPDGVPPC